MQREIKIHGRYADDLQQERFYVSLVSKMCRKDNVVLVAEKDKKIIGFIMGHVKFFEYGTSELVGECEHLYVYPDYRGGNG